MNVLIIDDEKNGVTSLQLLLKKYCTGVNVIGLAYSAEEGIARILDLKPDLIFLDIEMPASTGFDVINATSQAHDYEVIFTTAYDQYAIKAFKAHAVDYLLKPIDSDELKAAIREAERKIQLKRAEGSKSEVEVLLKNLAYSSKKISIPTSEGLILVNAEAILYLKSESNYTMVFLKNEQRILVSKTLKSMEDQLKYYSFCRVHTSYLININEVEKYLKGDGGTIILKNKVSIPVSRSYKQDLLNKL